MPDTSMPDDTSAITFRPYEVSDIPSVLALENDVFGAQRHQEVWEWKHQKNPYLDLTVVGISDASVVSSYTFLGFNLNASGRKIAAAQPTDAAVQNQFRAKGLYFKTFTGCTDLAIKQGVKVIFGNPNEQALPITLLKFKVKPVAWIPLYVRTLGLSQRWKTKLKTPVGQLIDIGMKSIQSCLAHWQSWVLQLKAPRGMVCSIQETLPETYEQLWNAVRTGEIVSVWKDSEYMRWRYSQHPRTRAKYFCLSLNDELLAMATVTQKGQGLLIAEFITRDRTVLTGKILLNSIYRHYCRPDVHGAEYLLFFGHDRGFFKSVFSEFERKPEGDMIMVSRVLPEDAQLDSIIFQPDCWTITAGDTDIV